MNPAAWVLAAVVAATVVAVVQLGIGEAALGRVSQADTEELAVRSPGRARRVVAVLDAADQVRAGVVVARVAAELLGTAALTVLLIWSGLPWPAVLAVVVVAGGVLGLVVRWVSARAGERRAVRALGAGARLLLAVRPLGRLLPAGPVQPGREEIVESIDEAHDIEVEDRELVRSVLELGGTRIREVMVPRTEMVTTEWSTPASRALSLFLKSGYSRVPVTGESVDDVRGVLFLKDVVRTLHTEPGSGSSPAGPMARPAVFVPESKPVDDLLREMQRGSSHIALVVDEYGGIAGLVTVEDLLEEIVGELTDEHDPAAPEVEEVDPGRYRVPARLPLDELGELFGMDLDDDDVDSAGGLLAKAIGKVPLAGSSARVDALEITAEQVTGRRKQVTTLLVRRADDADRVDQDEP